MTTRRVAVEKGKWNKVEDKKREEAINRFIEILNPVFALSKYLIIVAIAMIVVAIILIMTKWCEWQ